MASEKRSILLWLIIVVMMKDDDYEQSYNEWTASSGDVGERD